jgi:type IV pilus assembly protein PilY1
MGAGPHGPYPKLLWEFDSTHSAHLGDTWSEPVITRVKVQGPAGSGDNCGWDDGDGDCREEWVAVFGGGYTDAGNPNTGAYDAASLAGKGIFIVELDSGNLLASVRYDPLGIDGPDNMSYALPSSPAVVDLDFDGLADLVYIGDLGGQLWKWDLSAVGVDAGADGDIDNWSAGVLFEAPAEDMGGGVFRYKSIFYPPSVTYFKRNLYLAFATGEREELMYEGDPAKDENNRVYALEDPVPSGAGAFALIYSEADLTNITGLDTDPDPTDMGFFVVGRDGEKFVTNHTIIGGYLVTASFLPGEKGLCGGAAGGAILYVLHLNSGKGFFFDAGVTTGDAARRISIGSGVPTDPRIAISAEGGGRMYVKTSWGQVYQSPAPDPGYPPVELIYWRQNF